MKAFLTQCSTRASHSLIEIAHLVSLGILEGFFHVLILHVLGWSKLLDFDWWSRKFPRMDSLAQKENSRC